MSFKNAHIVGRNIDSTVYHEITVERGSPDHPVSPSMLKLFGGNAKKWRDGYEPKTTKTKDWGNLLDCLLLTPNQFKVRYAVQPETYEDEKTGEVKEWNNRARVCKEWCEDHEGKEIISFDTHKHASAAILKLREDLTVRAFVDASEKQVWVAGEWHDEATKLVIPVRCLIDLEPKYDSEFGKCLGDLKSTRSAALRPFLRDAYTYGHHIQAAFDMDLYRAALPDEDRNTWCLVVQENYEPWMVGRRMMTDDPSQPENFLDLGRVTYKRLLANYCFCLKHDRWPDYDSHENAVQGWSLMNAESWMAELPDAFELPEEDGDTESETNSSDIPS